MYFLTVCHGLCEPICRHIHNHVHWMSPMHVPTQHFHQDFHITAGSDLSRSHSHCWFLCLSPSLYRLAYCMCVVHASESAHVHCHSERSHAVNLHSVLYTAKMHCYVITEKRLCACETIKQVEEETCAVQASPAASGPLRCKWEDGACKHAARNDRVVSSTCRRREHFLTSRLRSMVRKGLQEAIF